MALQARALSATRAAYVRCGTCRHARVHHEDQGRGPCTSLVGGTTTDDQGRIRLTSRRCTCLRHTTDERIT